MFGSTAIGIKRRTADGRDLLDELKGKVHQGPVSEPRDRSDSLSQRRRVGFYFLVAALAAYLATFLSRIEEFPIYFHSDEAVNPVRFAELARNGWRAVEPPQEWLPAYFRNPPRYSLSLSVFVQGMAESAFGRSIRTVRWVSVLAGAAAALAMALLLRSCGVREWWVAVPVLACAPIWFLHTRTGLETVLAASAYAWALFFYRRYLVTSPGWIFGAVAASACTFYAYAPGQAASVVSILVLAIWDWRTHLRRWPWVLGAMAFAVLLMVPYARFRWLHPEMVAQHLRDLGIAPGKADAPEFWQWLSTVIGGYLTVLDPRWWFRPVIEPWVRHQPIFYGQFHFVLAPFALIGAGVMAYRREALARWVLLALIAVPASPAIVGISTYRVLALVPVLALVIARGFTWCFEQISDARLRPAVAAGTLGLLALIAWNIRTDCLSVGPQWSREYGLMGMQWGAPAVFDELLPRLAERFPRAHLVVSHTWANNPAMFLSYFGWGENGPRGRAVELKSLSELLSTDPPQLRSDDVVVFPDRELAVLRRSEIVARFEPLERIRTPDGRIGFHAGRIVLRDDFRELREQRRRDFTKPVSDELTWNGKPIRVTSAGVAAGNIRWLFQDVPGAYVRCHRGIPLVITVQFPEAISLRGVDLLQDDKGYVTVDVTAWNGDRQVAQFHEWRDLYRNDSRDIRWRLEGGLVDRIEIRVTGLPTDHLRVRRIELLGDDSP